MEKFIISNIDELDTFDSYFGTPHIKEGYISIPYINMGLMEEHPLNYTNDLIHVDFSFLQIVEPKYISVYGRGIIKNELETYDQKKSKWYGGLFIGNESILDSEMEIQASDIVLIVPKDFRVSSKMWIPDFGKFKGKGNVSEKEVLKFLSQEPPFT